jgi:uncharacterized membrane protein
VIAACLLAAAGACGGEGAPAAAPAAPAFTKYAAADTAIVTYCAGCHARDGRNKDHDRAHQVLPLDGYADWRSQTTVIAAVLDKQHLDGSVMPPADAPLQPSDAERNLLLDWTRRGAPDTPDGR